MMNYGMSKSLVQIE